MRFFYLFEYIENFFFFYFLNKRLLSNLKLSPLSKIKEFTPLLIFYTFLKLKEISHFRRNLKKNTGITYISIK